MTTPDGERVALTAFLTYTVLAGGNAVCIRFSNRELAPLWGASLRFALAAAVLLAIMVVLRLTFPRGRGLIGSLLYGLLNISAGFGLVYYGLVQVHAGLAQILLALVPLARSCSRCSGGRSASVPRLSWEPCSLSQASRWFLARLCSRTCPCCRCSRLLAARSASRKPWCS